MEYELKLLDGRVVTWEGRNGEDAAVRYEDCFRGTSVVAWRYVRHGLFIGMEPIKEPGDSR